jgi:hypothetical protein
MNCYVPSNLDFESLFPDCRKHRDKYYYFLHKIFEERIFDKRYKKDSFINLHSHTIREITGRKLFYVIRNDLISKNVIEVNHSYLVSEFSKSYRLTDIYRGIKHKKVKIEDVRILQRINKHKLKLINDIPVGREYEFLSNNLYKIDINHTEALKYINQYYSGNPDIYNAYRVSIDYIHEKTFFFKVDSIAGRCHTNISNLSKDLRCFLRYEGKPLINIDISNSQPFLFNILIQDFFKGKQPKTIFSYNNNTFSNFSKPSIYLISNYNNNPPYLVTFPDIVKYESLTSDGKFYEYLMKEAEINNENRQEFKKSFFGKVFFCQNQDHYTYSEAKLFRKLFPNVYKIILHYKKEDYKQLAINLQRAEANLMINKVCKRIAIERPEIFVSTIHDSILTTEENKDYICNVIINEFERNFNLKPSIKIE